MKTPYKIMAVAAIGLLSFAALLRGGSESSITVKSVWVYPFEVRGYGVFENVIVIEKTPTTIKFKAGEKVYEHCGQYTVEN